MQIEMSRHARVKWRSNIGSSPPEGLEITHKIRNSVRIQGQRDVFNKYGHRVRILALYWLPQDNIILKVDHVTRKVVTILFPKCAGSWRNAAPKIHQRKGMRRTFSEQARS